MEVTANATSGFRPDIQGLRAVAVGAVVLYHAGVGFFPGGYVGVDVFFVISGFLITSHLISQLTMRGHIRFASFYARRARRILPASFLVLVLTIVGALIWYPPLLMLEVWEGAVATALYVPNYLFAVSGTDYLAETTPSLFQHYWSLGIEEQFYILWPAVLGLGWALVRSRRALFTFLTLLTILSFVACVALTFRSQPWAFFSLPTRAWELGAGGLVAFALTRRVAPLGALTAAFMGWAGVLGILAAVVFFTSETAFPGYWALLPVAATAAVILGGATPSRAGPSSMLSLRGMQFVGAISYSLYLIHWPALLIPQAIAGFEEPLPIWSTLLIAAACVPLAWMLFHFVENPARRAPALANARPRRSLLAALAGSVACIAIATTALAYSSTRPLYAAQDAPTTLMTAPPKFTDYVPRNLTPSLRAASEDQPVIYSDGCHQSFSSTDSAGCLYGDPSAPRIVLFGDSHAAQWFPAIRIFAEANGFAVQSFTKSSCRSLTMPQTRAGVPYTECEVWRDGVIETLNTEKPALTILANYGGGAATSGTDAWSDGLRQTVERLPGPVAIMADTPDLGATPSVCLSAHLEDASACGLAPEAALRADVRDAERVVAESTGVSVIDLTPYICSPNACNPIIGSTLVYRDAHHLTATYSELLAAPLGDQLESVLSG